MEKKSIKAIMPNYNKVAFPFRIKVFENGKWKYKDITKAESSEIIENIDSTEVVIAKAEGHHIYVCTAAALTSLTITEVENSPRETVVRFTSGQTPTTIDLPESLKISWVGAPRELASYEMNIANNLAIIAQFPNS